MSGISSYFDGETGIVTKVEWKRDYNLVFIIHLKDNPNREYALDYNSDIRIDTTIQPGDKVIYRKLDDYAGFWFRQSHSGQPEELFKIRGETRRRKYKQLYLPVTLAVELLMSLVLSAVVTIAFYFVSEKPGEAGDLIRNIAFIVVFLSLTLSGLFRMLMKYPTISDIKDRGVGIIWDMIKFLAMEIVYVVIGTAIVLFFLALIFGTALKLVAPEILRAIEAFLHQNANLFYIPIAGFSFWGILHLFDLFRIRYSPEED